jgi:DNA-binding transcriptional MerR regulator
MSQRTRTYTLDEIEERTGFDKRTIAYYVQEDVLPKVGRRGPRTRYPQLFLDRLLFIKRVRDLQDTGRMGSMTLGDFRDVFEQLSAKEIADLAAGRKPIEPIAHGAYEPGLAAAAIASPRRRAKLMSEPLEESSSRHIESPSEEWPAVEMPRYASPDIESPEPLAASRVGELLALLARSAGDQDVETDRLSERWARARVTPEITIAARDLDDEAADSLEELARLLRQLMRMAERD